MSFHFRVPKPAWSGFLCPAMVAAAIFAGCSAGGDSPEAKQGAQARTDQIHKEEDIANAAMKKKFGKNAPTLKSIKGAFNQGGTATQ